MPTGTIARKIADRGFAFIKPDVGGADIFVHANEIKDQTTTFDDLQEGDSVEYETEMDHDRNKTRAINCRLAVS